MSKDFKTAGDIKQWLKEYLELCETANAAIAQYPTIFQKEPKYNNKKWVLRKEEYLVDETRKFKLLSEAASKIQITATKAEQDEITALFEDVRLQGEKLQTSLSYFDHTLLPKDRSSINTTKRFKCIDTYDKSWLHFAGPEKDDVASTSTPETKPVTDPKPTPEPEAKIDPKPTAEAENPNKAVGNKTGKENTSGATEFGTSLREFFTGTGDAAAGVIGDTKDKVNDVKDKANGVLKDLKSKLPPGNIPAPQGGLTIEDIADIFGSRPEAPHTTGGKTKKSGRKSAAKPDPIEPVEPPSAKKKEGDAVGKGQVMPAYEAGKDINEAITGLDDKAVSLWDKGKKKVKDAVNKVKSLLPGNGPAPQEGADGSGAGDDATKPKPGTEGTTPAAGTPKPEEEGFDWTKWGGVGGGALGGWALFSMFSDNWIVKAIGAMVGALFIGPTLAKQFFGKKDAKPVAGTTLEGQHASENTPTVNNPSAADTKIAAQTKPTAMTKAMEEAAWAGYMAEEARLSGLYMGDPSQLNYNNTPPNSPQQSQNSQMHN